MVMINQFDLIDTDVDDPLQIALAQIEILKKKAAVVAKAEAAAAAEAEAKAAAAAAEAEAKAAAAAVALAAKVAAALAVLELPLEETKTKTETETEKGVLAVPQGSVAYQSRSGQNGHGRNSGRNFENNRNGDGFFAVPNGRGKGSGRNFENNRNGDGYSSVAEDKLLGKPSIRGHYDQQYHSRGGGRGRGYLNRDNGEYADQPSRRQYDRRSGLSSQPAKVKGELAPPVKDVPVPQVELGMTPEQNLEENATLEGKSSIPKETVELDNAPSSNALNKDKEGMANGRKEKEPEVKVMTLREYQKVLEEKKRKDLVAMKKKTQERKVDVDKEFESMQQLVVKKENNEFFIKLGNDKEAGKRKEDTDGDERVKKDTNGGDESGVKKDTDRVERRQRSVNMFEFLDLAGGRRGRGRGGRGGQGGRGGRGYSNSFSDEFMKDSRQFPALGGKEVEQQQHSSAAQWKKVEQQQQHSSAAQGRK